MSNKSKNFKKPSNASSSSSASTSTGATVTTTTTTATTTSSQQQQQQQHQPQRVEQLQQQLQILYQTFQTNYYKTQVLHLQWITYLFVLSYIVIVLSCYPIYTKYKSILTTTSNKSTIYNISVILQLLQENATHLLSLLVAIFISLFIYHVKRQQETSQQQQQQSQSDSQQKQRKVPIIFTHYTFHCTRILIVCMIYSYYRPSIMTKMIIINRVALSIPYIQIQKRHEQDNNFPFPYMVIIFCCITTTCVYMMQHQMKQMVQYQKSLITLQNELLQKRLQQQQKEKAK